jgi:hypothetical protein
VYVVNAEDVAQMRPVQLAILQGEDALIAQGVSAGERIVIEGQEQIKPNSAVTPRTKDEPARGAAHGGKKPAQAGAPADKSRAAQSAP